MKALHYFIGILCAFALMIALLITSIEAVAYWTPGYYEAEYAKYNVTGAVSMEMEDLLEVTEEMMAYLRGKRPDLHVPTIVDGQPREFFNEREIAHMEDVRELFLGGIAIRRFCILAMAILVGLLFALRAKVSQVLPVGICVGTSLFFVILGVLAGIIASDFSKYFIVFHEMFFNNDLWILNPATDLLINIVPEAFFMDTAARIGITYGLAVVTVLVVSLILIYKNKKTYASTV